jgi:D-serine deaminase-like pyridoxal phosphate-dependent protein
MCDAGGIALSKDTGPMGGYGELVGSHGKGWRIGRISQEHGILVASPNVSSKPEPLQLGDMVEIVGQHACLIAAAYPWYYVVDSSAEDKGTVVKDVWVPWKGW